MNRYHPMEWKFKHKTYLWKWWHQNDFILAQLPHPEKNRSSLYILWLHVECVQWIIILNITKWIWVFTKQILRMGNCLNVRNGKHLIDSTSRTDWELRIIDVIVIIFVVYVYYVSVYKCDLRIQHVCYLSWLNLL